MKKVIILGSLALAAVALLPSCKKNYTCSCTANGVTYTYLYSKTTKSDAQDLCTAQEADWKNVSSSASCSVN